MTMRAVGLLLGMILCGASLAQTGLAPPPPPGRPNAAAAPPQRTLIDEARAAVAASLKDPAAEYRNVRARNAANPGGAPTYVVCGDVNAKNEFGRSTGFAPFVFLASDRSTHVLGLDQNIATITMLGQFCR